jgi:two-component system cell cycle response regulator
MASASKQRVLIVDDSKIVRTTIARLIRTTFDVREEADGEAGWAALEADPSIVVVISDLHMPKLDGFALLEKIRRATNARVRDMPVIMISGNEDDATKKKARSAGANDFITKSTDGTEILSRIDNLLRLVQTKQDLDASREALATTVIRDPLTGTFTPQYLATEGAKLFSAARRHGSALSAICFRIDSHADNTQKVGKEVAGQLLARVAKLVMGNLRTEDSMGRTGESTFVVLSPSTSAQQAVTFAKRLRDQLEAAKVNYREHVLRMRTSIGIASLGHDSAGTIEELMKAAMQRLERATPQGMPSVAPSGAPSVAPSIASSLASSLAGKEDAAPAKPAGLPAEIESAIQAFEYAHIEKLGEGAAEVLRRLLPFLHAVCRRLQIELPVDKILEALKARRK